MKWAKELSVQCAAKMWRGKVMLIVYRNRFQGTHFWNPEILNVFMFENTLFKRSSREQPMKRLIKHFCTMLSTMGLLFCLSWGPTIINKITANNWVPWFEVLLTAGHRQCQFSLKCIKADLELVSADKSIAIAQSYLRLCRSAQCCCLALTPVFVLFLSCALSVAKAWVSQAFLMQNHLS